MKRDFAVELGRILACCIVIGVHICLPSLIDNSYYDISRVYISCLVADGVAIFWLITGCFLFKNNPYKKVLSKTFKNIGIPMLIFSLICFYFSSWIFYDTPLLQGFVHSKEEYISVFKTLLTWNNPVPCGSHLWYLYTYILLMIIYPVLKSFVDYLDADYKRIKFFILISFSFLFINDITSNQLANFSLNSVSATLPAAIEVIYGHFLYKHRELFKKKIYLLSSIIFLGVNLIRAYLQLHNYYATPSNTHILFWYSTFGVICAISLLIFCFSLSNYIKNERFHSSICYIASFTFTIYIIHTYVIALLGKYGITNEISFFISLHFKKRAFNVLYTITFIILVFFISFLIAFVIRYIKIWFVKFYQKIDLNIHQ